MWILKSAGNKSADYKSAETELRPESVKTIGHNLIIIPHLFCFVSKMQYICSIIEMKYELLGI